MNLRSFLGLVGTVALATMAAACTVATDPPVDVGGRAPTDDPTYTVTSVVIARDGSQTITHGTVRLSEQIAAREGTHEVAQAGVGTAEQALVQATCGSSTLHLWDDTGYTGNEICFVGDISLLPVNLGNYTRTGRLSWAEAVRSYKSNQQFGQFSITGSYNCSSGSPCVGFSTNTNKDPASSCEQSARYLRLGDMVCEM